MAYGKSSNNASKYKGHFSDGYISPFTISVYRSTLSILNIFDIIDGMCVIVNQVIERVNNLLHMNHSFLFVFQILKQML